MRKNSLNAAFAVVVSGVLLTGCGGLGKMEKYIEQLGAKSAPNPLEVHGDSIQLTITGKFPEKYFHKKVVAEATPVLKYDGGETAFKMKGFQGEQAAGNYESVPYKTGKSFSYSSTIAYSPAMETSNLELRMHGTQGKKVADFAPIPVGQGVITTPYLMKSDDKSMVCADKFVRTLSFTKEAEVNFDYNSSSLKPAEMKQADITELGNFLDSCMKNPKMVVKKIEFQAYASPEGEILLNDNLATERAEAGKKVVVDVVKKKKLTNVNESMYQLVPKGEDWEGFRAQMEKSAIADRDIIIRILQKTADLASREQEIKNISKTYTEIQKDIFPSLRRCKIVVSYDLEGYSDADLKQISTTNPSVLTYEELMKAGSLTEDLGQKVSIYSAAAAKSDADYRAANNLGVAYYMQNKTGDADAQWKKAYEMKKTPETSCNMGISARLKGDRKAAVSFANESGSAEAKYNKGLVDIQNGDYSSAVANMGSYKTFNSALANMLNKDNGSAKSHLDASGDSSAIADYLAAIIAARSNESATVASKLKDAAKKDTALVTKAKKDLEFRNFKDAVSFQ
jgi:outer membrane protein OmpA-like peptidoglycan-associated protein